MSIDLLSFQEAIEDSSKYSKRHLLLGNGFSIGCCPSIFHYASLFTKADFTNNPSAANVFEELGIQDFEIAIRSLENASKILPLYLPEQKNVSQKMISDATTLKDLLVSTIAENHPAKPNDISPEKFLACRKFLNNFVGDQNNGQIFTLNYDLLLYWTLMHDNNPDQALSFTLSKSDSFGNDEASPDADYVVWQGEKNAHGANIYFLHGALHLFDSGSEIKKYTWIRKGVPLVDQVRESINNHAFPLFVVEGDSKSKKAKIRHNAYLYQGYKTLTSNVKQQNPCFFIYGHSLHDNDDHILKRLAYGKFPHLYVGIYGDTSTDENRRIIAKAQNLAALRDKSVPLSISFYDSATANVWGE